MNDITTANQTGVSTASDNAFAAYGEATTQRNIVGELLKFSKGEYLAGQNGTEVPEGTRLVANMDQLLIGWIKWENGAPASHEMGRIAEGYAPAKRNELGDTNKDEWDVDEATGAPRDPWQFSNYLLMKDVEDGQLYTFTTSSRGGLNAIGELCKVYGKEMRQRPGQYPIVSLDVDSYKHQNKAYGKIFVPMLKVVGWTDATVFDGDGPVADAEEAPAKTAGGRGKAQAAATADARF